MFYSLFKLQEGDMGVTGEKVIMNSSIKCFGGMYKSLTECHDGGTRLFEKNQLTNFFYEFFEYHNPINSKFKRNKLMLANLNQTGTVKDFNYVSANMFWWNWRYCRIFW